MLVNFSGSKEGKRAFLIQLQIPVILQAGLNICESFLIQPATNEWSLQPNLLSQCNKLMQIFFQYSFTYKVVSKIVPADLSNLYVLIQQWEYLILFVARPFPGIPGLTISQFKRLA